MLEGILWAFVCFFCFVGMLEVIREVERLIQRSAGRVPALVLLPLRGEVEDIELVLRGVVNTLEDCPQLENSAVAIVDLGMARDTREICRLFSRDFHCVQVFEKDEICAIIQEQMVR